MVSGVYEGKYLYGNDVGFDVLLGCLLRLRIYYEIFTSDY